MKDLFLNNSLNAIIKSNPNYTETDIEKIKYGLEGIYLTITKTIFIIILSVLFGIIKEMLIILILFNILRYFAFGFHAETSTQCLIFSTLLFVGIPLLIFNLKPIYIIKIIITIFCITAIAIFAPADTKKDLCQTRKKD